MSDDILNQKHFTDDEDILAIRGGTVYKKIIPIILNPTVVFPFRVMHEEITDEYEIDIFKQAYEEHTVVGFLYHPPEELNTVPGIGQVGTSAIIEEFDKTVKGSYMVKIVPASRFFTTDYVDLEKGDRLQAKVSHYGDLDEDEEILKPLEDKYRQQLFRLGELLDAKVYKNVFHEDTYMLTYYSFIFISNFSKLSEPEKLRFIWERKFSERLKFVIKHTDEHLASVERIKKRIGKDIFDYKNN